MLSTLKSAFASSSSSPSPSSSASTTEPEEDNTSYTMPDAPSTWTNTHWSWESPTFAKEDQPVLADFVCPLTGCIMDDPVTTSDGFSYERVALQRWFEEHKVSEGKAMSVASASKVIDTSFVPNTSLRLAISQWARSSANTFDGAVNNNNADGPLLPSCSSLSSPPRTAAATAETKPTPPCTWQGVGFQPKDVLRTATPPSAAIPTTTDNSHPYLLQQQHRPPPQNLDFSESLSKFFTEFDKTKGLLEKVLAGWKPPKFVVVGGESAGKSTFLEQLLMLPLFPRNLSFCTRMAVHVKLRRTPKKSDDTLGVDGSVQQPTVTMAVRDSALQPLTTASVERIGGTSTLLRKVASSSRDSSVWLTPKTTVSNGAKVVIDRIERSRDGDGKVFAWVRTENGATGYLNIVYCRPLAPSHQQEEAVSIPVATGFEHVQRKMDELVKDDTCVAVEGVVRDKVLVLEVRHPNIPSVDLVDVPGFTTVPPKKVEAVERTLERILENDAASGGHSLFLALVPASERPNSSTAMAFLQKHQLDYKAIGIFTKCDTVQLDKVPELRALVTGEDLECCCENNNGKTEPSNNGEATVVSAEQLGSVKLGLGWKAIMLKPPTTSTSGSSATAAAAAAAAAGGGGGGVQSADYFSAHNIERLALQKKIELAFFQTEPWVSSLPADCLGVGAVVTQLEKAYLEYLNTTWRDEAMRKVLIKFQRTDQQRLLLGNDGGGENSTAAGLAVESGPTFKKDQVAAAEVTGRLAAVLNDLRDEFCLMLEDGLKPGLSAALATAHGQHWGGPDISRNLATLRERLTHVTEATVAKVKVYWVSRLQEVFTAKFKVEKDQGTGDWVYAASPPSFSRAIRKKSPSFVAPTLSALYRQVKSEPFIEISQYPDYVGEIMKKIEAYVSETIGVLLDDQKFLLDRLLALDSPWLEFTPSKGCKHVVVTVKAVSFVAASVASFMKSLPQQEVLIKLPLGVPLGKEDSVAATSRVSLEQELSLVSSARASIVEMLAIPPELVKHYEDEVEWNEDDEDGTPAV